jgi:hypothetical protein
VQSVVVRMRPRCTPQVGKAAGQGEHDAPTKAAYECHTTGHLALSRESGSGVSSRPPWERDMGGSGRCTNRVAHHPIARLTFGMLPRQLTATGCLLPSP